MYTLGRLSLAEKVQLLSGSHDDFVSTPGILEKDITPVKVPSSTNSRRGVKKTHNAGYQTADGINGIRPNTFHGELTTASFPNTTCLACTWNVELLERMGLEITRQAKTKHAQLILGPTINIQRDPRAGRNFECFSEDPLLSGYLGAAIVNGIQNEGFGACPKHFVCNDSETMRRYYDVVESPYGRTLREIYLAAWQYLLKKSNPVAVMTAYNKVDGEFCSENGTLIGDVLRKEWGFDGIVMSDWFGTHSVVEAVKAGLDLEMPQPIFRGEKLIEAVQKGQVTKQEIDVLVSRMLQLRNRMRSSYSTGPEKSEIIPESIQVIRQLAHEGIVLLKNERSVLPLQMTRPLKIAVIGEYAKNPAFKGGGSASCKPQYHQVPLDVLREAHAHPEDIAYAPGVRVRRIIPMAPSELLTAKNGQRGVDVSYFNHDSQEPLLTETLAEPTVFMLGHYKPGLQLDGSHIEMSTELVPTTTGTHTLALRHSGAISIAVDGVEVLSRTAPDITTEQFMFNLYKIESRVQIPMDAGKPYRLQINMQARKPMIGEPTPYGLTFCFEEYYPEDDAVSEAADLAAKSDVSIIYAGRNDQYESEGFDLEDITLPSNQVAMIKAVAAASKRTVLLLHCGNPIDVSSFVGDIDAVVAIHFTGQEGPTAVVDILTGKVNPSGRLAATWFKTIQDWPSFQHFPAKEDNGTGKYEIQYKEGLMMGYRAPISPDRIQWPFGHGLSYTSFLYEGLSVSVTRENLKVDVRFTNTGRVPGKEVVQVYVCAPEGLPRWRPQRELKGFTKIFLEAGESRDVSLEIDIVTACGRWDETARAWIVDSGTYAVEVGGNSSHFVI